MRTVFVHSRFGPNRSHGAYARALGATFVPLDFLLPWEGRSSSPLRRYASWLICATFFPRPRTYDVVLSDGPQFPVVLMRRLHVLRRQQRLVAIVGDDTLYRLRTGAFSRRPSRALTRALRTYDALLCVGQMNSDLARDALGAGTATQVLTVYPVLGDDRALADAEPDLDGANVVLVAHGPSAPRAWSKGLDLALDAVARARTAHPELTLTVVGQWDASYVHGLLTSKPDLAHAVSFSGPVDDLAPVFRSSALCMQLSRGEAFGMSVMEAMAAGVPCVVSEWTGVKEIVGQVEPRLVVPLDAGAAGDCVTWYLELPLAEKQALSARCRAAVAAYSDERALAGLRAAVATVVAR